jgi:thiol-disulfide isomerase/thioredoxin
MLARWPRRLARQRSWLRPPEVGDVIHLPDVKLLDGRTVPASQWAGKPLVVEIWASWCPFCALQNPRLQACTTRRAARRCRC